VAEKQGFKRSGPGLKPGVNEADTGSVVGSVRGTVSFGRMRSSGNSNAKNNMVSGNASRKR
jgi:hypothetical protein